MTLEEQVKRSKPVIGLAGGIASGKSLVAGFLAELGAGVIDADELNHRILHRDDVRRQVQRWWGRDLYDGRGRLDRRSLARIIFEDPTQRAKLEGLTHPLVDQLRRDMMNCYEADETITAIVLDIPLLFEVRQHELCDHVIFVEVDEPTRLQRVRQHRGWDEAELDRREKQQNPLDVKRNQADHIVENNSDINTLRQRVAGIYHQLINPLKSSSGDVTEVE